MSKKLYPIASIFLTVAVFLVLFIVTLVNSIQWNAEGMYGASSFAPLIATVVFGVLIFGIQALVITSCKKKGKADRSSLGVKLMIIPIAIIVGIFGILDIAMPPILDDATSGTIKYEDVIDDWQGTHNAIKSKVELFKEKNKDRLGENWQDVKYTDQEFQDLFRPLFESMDQAYKRFNPLAIEMALDSDDMLGAITSGNLPLDVVLTLILDTDDMADYKNGVPLMDIINMNWTKLQNALVDTILDAILNGGLDLGAIMGGGEVDINEILGAVDFNILLNGVLKSYTCEYVYNGVNYEFTWNIFNILGENMLMPDVDPNADMRNDGAVFASALGYQDMAWLDGIPMMFFIPLMSVRNIFYAFAALLGLASVSACFIAQAYSRKYNTQFSYFMLKTKPVED